MSNGSKWRRVNDRDGGVWIVVGVPPRPFFESLSIPTAVALGGWALLNLCVLVVAGGAAGVGAAANVVFFIVAGGFLIVSSFHHPASEEHALRAAGDGVLVQRRRRRRGRVEVEAWRARPAELVDLRVRPVGGGASEVVVVLAGPRSRAALVVPAPTAEVAPAVAAARAAALDRHPPQGER